jgi:hypothetical protein
MKMRNTILKQFPAHLFWDIDISRLDVEKDKDLIIPRALFATTAATFDHDISRLELLYDKQQIVHTLRHTKERVSNTVCKLVANHYHVPRFFRYSPFKYINETCILHIIKTR